MLAHKKVRKVALGDSITLIFEDELTLCYQSLEMLRVERIFEEFGIQDELDAYNPLVPNGSNWKATMLIEYPDPEVRRVELAQLKGVEDRAWVRIAGHDRVFAIADEDLERENDVKTSSAHFLRFELTDAIKLSLRGGPRAASASTIRMSWRPTRRSPRTCGSRCLAISLLEAARRGRAASIAVCMAALVVASCTGVDVKPSEQRRRGEVDTSQEGMANGSIFGPRERARELEAKAPPSPADADLLPFDLRNNTDLKAAIDKRSLAVGTDGVVRYVLVLTSSRGVRNVSFEGIRCDPAEWRMYSIGQPDGTWSAVRQSEWRAAEQKSWNSIRFTLAKDYLCEATGLPARDATAIIRKLKNSIPSRNTRTNN